MVEKTKEAAAEDALPMQKAGVGTFVVAGAAIVVLGGLAVYSMSGGTAEANKEEATQASQAAEEAQGMTKAELEERQAHLKRTQLALIAAAAEEEAEGRKEKKQAAAAAPAAPAPAARSASTARPAPAPKPVVNKKKSLDGLDALGADITSALK